MTTQRSSTPCSSTKRASTQCSSTQRAFKFFVTTEGYKSTFLAMGSPCEIQIEARVSVKDAQALLQAGFQEAIRIEQKYSRYCADNLVAQINRAERISVDEETQRLFDYAEHCFRASSGRFDITSGVLRRFWRFDGGEVIDVPDAKLIRAALNHIGWDKVYWKAPWFQLPVGMEIDFGGVAKEYAVDRVLLGLRSEGVSKCLVNFGGDLATSALLSDKPWSVGIEQPHVHGQAAQALTLHNGALATSGSTHRFCRINGELYGHILNPRTGYPVNHAPLSVTCFSETCTQAGMLSTFAMLHGQGAEAFLAEQGVQAWVIRA